MVFLLAAIICLNTVSDLFALDLSLLPGVSPKNLLLYAAFGLLILQATVTKAFRLEQPVVIGAFLALFVYATITVAVNMLLIEANLPLMSTVVTLKNYLVDYLIIFVTFLYGTRSRSDAMLLIKTMLGCIAIANVVTMGNALGIVSVGEVEFEGERVLGAFGHANETGTLLAMYIPLYIACIATAKGGFERLVWLLGVAAAAAVLIMTSSRGGLFALVLGGGIGIYLNRDYLPVASVLRWSAIGIGAAILIAVVIGGPYADVLLERIVGQSTFNMGYASSGRTDLWQRAIETMLDHPISFLTGMGWGMWDASGFEFVAHNTYMTYWFELGLIGLVLLMVLGRNCYATVTAAVASADKGTRAYLMGFAFGVIILAIALSVENLFKPWLYVWPMAGIMARQALLSREAARAQVPRESRPGLGLGAKPISARNGPITAPRRPKPLRS